jgi:cell division protein FtsA
VFYEGSIRHTAIVPLGGASVTNDIAIGMRTPIDQAETHQDRARLRARLDGRAARRARRPGVGGARQGDPRQQLASMIEPRMEEIFTLANAR